MKNWIISLINTKVENEGNSVMSNVSYSSLQPKTLTVLGSARGLIGMSAWVTKVESKKFSSIICLLAAGGRLRHNVQLNHSSYKGSSSLIVLDRLERKTPCNETWSHPRGRRHKEEQERTRKHYKEHWNN